MKRTNGSINSRNLRHRSLLLLIIVIFSSPHPALGQEALTIGDFSFGRTGSGIFEEWEPLTFGEKLPMISGIAIMTDSDNTKEAATAYYGDIEMKRKAP